MKQKSKRTTRKLNRCIASGKVINGRQSIIAKKKLFWSM